ncbi:MAG: hypothetical protein GF344_02680 [Chitinivibrionales bacterium]|nr:hypothetical protein [Chitinivibrionales bacterium]MBD3355988.1 hypothetical protein [Chitinivibrionales bacterium]
MQEYRRDQRGNHKSMGPDNFTAQSEKTYVGYRNVVEELRKRILPASSVLIATHDYPDPDCLASAWGIYHLLRHWGIENPVITFGGFVGRSENRTMLRVLGMKVKPLVVVTPTDFERVILVDTFPASGNLSLPTKARTDAVIDHHPRANSDSTSFFCDVREEIGATSTLVTQYLRAAHCPIPETLATALFYGIKTDTRDMSRNVSHEDLECYRTLFDWVDHRLLSRIEFPDRDVEYFRMLHRAAGNMLLLQKVGYTHLGLVSTPDHIAEIADLFLSLETLEWTIVSGVFEDQIFYSVRSKESETAGQKAQLIARRLNGSGGGHSSMAAGRIPMSGLPENRVRERFIEVIENEFGVSRHDVESLITGQ